MTRIWGGAGLLFVLPMLAAAGPVRDDLLIVGTGDGEQLLRALAVAYRASGGERVLVPPAIGASGAIAAVGSDQVAAGRISRILTSAERESGLVSRPLFGLDIAFIAHPALDISALTAQQLASLFSGVTVSWGELGGPDVRVKVVGRHDSDATLAALRAGMPGWRNLKLSERAAFASNAAEAIETVRRAPGSIAFVPYSTTLAQDVRVIAVDGREPGRPGYPWSITLALVFKAENADRLKALIGFADGERGAAIARDLGARQARP